MRTLLKSIFAIALLLGPCCALAGADGGQIRLVEQHSDYQLTVFTSPTPLRAGPIDVSVLIQNTTTSQTVAAATITVELTSPDKSQPPIRAAASSAAATNKLLQAALIELPAAGPWNVRVECTIASGNAPFAAIFTADAAPPLPQWLTVWPWFAWPFVAILIFAVHRTLVANRQSRRIPGGTPGASSDGHGRFVSAPPRTSPSLRDVPPNPALQVLTQQTT